MPPKPKFTKKEIILAAIDITRNEGFNAISARVLGKKLGSSSKPIFSVFENMEEVQTAVVEYAKETYNQYIQKGILHADSNVPRCKYIGQQYIKFAIAEPKLFQLLFMKEQEHILNFENILPNIDMNYKDILIAIETDYGLDSFTALRLYQNIWIYAHGIASLCATKTCSFTEEEISEMLSEVFTTLLLKEKMRD